MYMEDSFPSLLGDGQMDSLKGRDFLTLQDFSADEIWCLLNTTRSLKRKDPLREYGHVLEGKSVLLIFQKASTRTRVSFEVAISQLGGFPISLGWNEAQLGRGETVADTARVLNRYVDCVVARVYHHGDLKELASHANIPVINALSDMFHPCQIVADLFTMWEHFSSLESLKLAYIGDSNNVCNSLLIGCSKLGVDVVVASPHGYRPKEEVLNWARANAEESGSQIEVIAEPTEAVRDANVVYTDVFVSMGFEKERAERLKVFMPKYQVTPALFKYAADDVVFMHCLPAHRGEEVKDEVIDGLHSIVWDQAENRLHTAKAILSQIL